MDYPIVSSYLNKNAISDFNRTGVKCGARPKPGAFFLFGGMARYDSCKIKCRDYHAMFSCTRNQPVETCPPKTDKIRQNENPSFFVHAAQ